MHHHHHHIPIEQDDALRAKDIYRVTIWGGVVNVLLIIIKFLAGFFGRSSAMIADAVHSFSDFITDVIVLLFVKISNKPADADHAYGHGKYETLATTFVGFILLGVGLMLAYEGAIKIVRVVQGEVLPCPEKVALWAALASIALKEITYQFTARVGKKINSQAVIANAWHHRSDALSSIGTGLGIAGAILLGDKWTVLDPIAAVVVSIFIIVAAVKIIKQALDELLEKSLDETVQNEIRTIVEQDKDVSELHHLRTRRVGNHYAIEMHLRMPGATTLYEAHTHSMQLELKLKQRFGAHTHVGIHIEPTKINGEYSNPEDCPC